MVVSVPRPLVKMMHLASRGSVCAVSSSATRCAVPGTILTTSTAQLGCKWPPGDRHEWERVLWGCLNGFDEECSFRQTEDALRLSEAEEVGQEAFEEGEDEEQVHKGSGMLYLTTTIRRLKLACK